MLVDHRTRRLLLVSTPVGPLGSGRGGGVELTLANIARELERRGHVVGIIAPDGSYLEGLTILEVTGASQPYAQYQGRAAPIVMPADSVLAAMWETVASLQDDYDLVLNFAYDWLPLYLTPFFRIPVLHLISMSSLTDAVDGAIAKVLDRSPEYLAVHTHAQAVTFPGGEAMRVIRSGLDLRRYPFNPQPDARLCWVGRIAPEKGLEDAAAVSQRTGIPLDICGAMQDARYWQSIVQQYPDARLDYQGFLSTDNLARVLGRGRALLMTPKWTEALGNVAIEALACGTPVIAYRRGGPAEIIEDGKTGWLVEPDDVAALSAAVHSIERLDRHICRVQAEELYSLEALGSRLEDWFAAADGATAGTICTHAHVC